MYINPDWILDNVADTLVEIFDIPYGPKYSINPRSNTLYDTSCPNLINGITTYALYIVSKCHLLFKKMYTFCPHFDRFNSVSPCAAVWYKKKADPAPNKLNNTGIHFILGLKNSASTIFMFLGNTNIA